MAKQRIPLVGSIIARQDNGVVSSDKDQVFTNCFPVVNTNALTKQSSADLVKRRGYSLAFTIGSSSSFAESIGYCVWSGYNDLAVFSQTNTTGAKVEIYDSTGTIVGAQFAGVHCTSITETLISNVPTLVALVYNSTSYTVQDAFYYQAGGAWTKITDAEFPGNNSLKTVGEPVHKDGYMFIMDEFGRIWNSDLNSLTAWTSTSFVDANDAPDKGAGLALSGNMIAALGRRSIQFFQNAGNATGSPLTRVPKTINLGIENIGSVYRAYLTVADVTYFIGFNREDAVRGVYMLSGTEYTKVSNTFIDELLNAASYSYVHIVGTFTDHDQLHVLFRAAVVSVMYFVYTPKTGVWWKFTPATDWSLVGAACDSSLISGRSLYSTFSGAVLEGKDNGTAFTLTVQTRANDHGTDNLKECTVFRLIADTQTVAGNVAVSYSDNDGVSFSTPKNIDMTQKQKKLDAGLGWFKSRIWKFTDTVARPFRASAFEVEWEEAEE
jgi:hypothetical protein